MYGVKWLIRDRRHHDRDGEMDFLIVHPQLGVLVLEVKGGGIRVDGPSGSWFSVDRYGDAHQIKNPFDQARSNLYDLMTKLEEAPLTMPFCKQYRMQRGVALPNIVVGSGDIGLYGDRAIIIDSTDLNSLDAAVRRVMDSPLKQSALSSDAIKALVQTLQPTMEIKRFGLGARIIEADQEIARLTEQQFQLLDFLQLHTHVAIGGCAGSGKTMLAIEKARRLAIEGFQVLFTCYNRNLAHWVHSQFDIEPDDVRQNVTVQHYHGLVASLRKKAGFAMPAFPTDPDKAQTFYDEIMPQSMSEALHVVDDRFDAIIADEGQDFQEMWWLTLLEALRDPDHGIFYIFYDDNQRIYADHINLPIEIAPYSLDSNFRNTVPIHDQVVRYFGGEPKPKSIGPPGIEPEFIDVADQGPLQALRKVFARLFTQENVPTGDVVILTTHSQPKSVLKSGTRVGNVRLTWDSYPQSNEVRVSTIHAFKGLESPIVILTELDHLHENGQQDYLMYVGLSRARDHLIVLGELPEPTINRIEPAEQVDD